MELLVGGAVLGFIMSVVIYQNKVWRLQDKVDHYKHKAEFYKEECKNMTRQVAEWELCKEKSDLFSKF